MFKKVLLFAIVGVFMNSAFAIGAVTYIGSDTCSQYTDSFAFQYALDEVDDSLGTGNEITKIYLYGGDANHYFVASGDYFVIDSLVDSLEIQADNSPWLHNGIRINGDKVHIHAPYGGYMYIHIDGGYGINNYGSNNKIEDLDINGVFYGIHSDAVNANIYCVRIDSCGSGILGHGYGNSLTISKALISNSSYNGCIFSNNIIVHIDRTTINGFYLFGIYNDSPSSSYVHCKRCLVYKNDTYSAGQYCYYRVTFDDAWSGLTNDNVAMGNDCQTDGHDFYGCSGSQKTSYDDYPINYTGTQVSEFLTSTANMIIQNNYPSGWYAGHTEASCYMLAKYHLSGSNMIYDDNVGYDTNIGKGIAKEFLQYQTDPITNRIELITYPSPFNSAVNIHVSSDADVEIYNLQGKKVAELSDNNSVWHPESELETGMYLVRAVTEDGSTVTKKIIYMR